MNGMVRLSVRCGSSCWSRQRSFATRCRRQRSSTERESVHKFLEREYGVPIKPGRYWYDNVSGALSRDVRADTWCRPDSCGAQATAVQFGGMPRKAIPVDRQRPGVARTRCADVAALLVVVPGSYGCWRRRRRFEGGPPSSILAALRGRGPSGGSSTSCEDYGERVDVHCSNRRNGFGIIGERWRHRARCLSHVQWYIMAPN